MVLLDQLDRFDDPRVAMDGFVLVVRLGQQNLQHVAHSPLVKLADFRHVVERAVVACPPKTD